MPSGVPFPGIWAAAQQQASAQLAALIAAASGATRRQSREGRQFIRGLTRAYANELKGIAGGIGATYDEAQREQSSMNAALGSYLSGAGQQAANQLGDQLAFASPAAQAQFAGGQAAVGQTGANVGYAMGAQNLNRVTSEKASERAYGQSLPATAFAYGQQSARQFEKQQGRMLQDQISQIRAQQPAFAADLYQAMAGLAMQQRQLALQEEELDLQRRSMGQEGARAGNERLDKVRSMAYDHISRMVSAPSDPVAAQGWRPPSHDDIRQAVESFYRNYFPNAPRDIIDREVDNAIGQFGYVGIGERAFSGFADALQPLGSRGSMVGQLSGVNPFTSYLYGRERAGGFAGPGQGRSVGGFGNRAAPPRGLPFQMGY